LMILLLDRQIDNDKKDQYNWYIDKNILRVSQSYSTIQHIS